MSVFVLCSATAAAGMAVAFEVGRVAEKRLSGSSKNAMPFEGFDWQSEHTKMAAYVFAGLFFVEIVFLPRAWNPFSHLASSPGSSSTSSYSSVLAFLVFGTWSGILAVGFGGIATSFQVLHTERLALDALQSDLEADRTKHEKEVREEKEKLARVQRTNLASAAAVAGEWKKLHIAREEDLHRGLERSENEKIWSKTIAQEFDKKVMRVVDNATDKRWREIQDQDLTLEAMRLRNREKEKKLKEQRALRAERATSEKETLKEETSKLLRMTDELEDLKSNMEKLKEENKQKEHEKIWDLKERELALNEKQKALEETHQQKLDQLKAQETKLKSKEEFFESGEEQKKLQELSKQLESSKLTVAKFNEEVMKKEKEKLEEFRKREMEIKRREEQLAQKSVFKYMSSDEMTEDKSISLRLMVEREIKLESSKDTASLEIKPESSKETFSPEVKLESSKDTFSPEVKRESSKETFSPEVKLEPSKDTFSPEVKLEPSRDVSSKSTIKKVKTSKSSRSFKPRKPKKVQVSPEDEMDLATIDRYTGDESLLDESIASTWLLNDNEDAKNVEDRNDNSDSEDSLSHQIQREIAAVEREGGAPPRAAIDKSKAAVVPVAPLSPLQEKIRNTFFGGTMDTIPKSPTSGSNVWDAITMNPTNHSNRDGMMLTKGQQQENTASPKTTRKSFHKAAPPSPMKKSTRTKKSGKGKRSFVVSEDAAVEVVAWSGLGGF